MDETFFCLSYCTCGRFLRRDRKGKKNIFRCKEVKCRGGSVDRDKMICFAVYAAAMALVMYIEIEIGKARL